MLYRHCLIVSVTAVLSCNARAGVVFVDDDNCPGTGSGTEADPYCSIQTAIENAANMDEIVVAPGTYFETIDFVAKAITLRSLGGPDVTTIDGTGHFHVVQCVSGEGPDTVLDGFAITGGNADGNVFPDANAGGGMFNHNSSPTVTNCSFHGNAALYLGGGMFNDNSHPAVSGCTLEGNSALFGGGMFNDASNPMVTDCTFAANSAESVASLPGLGAGMHNTGSSSPTVTGCSFIENTTVGAGGGMHNSGSNPTVINCVFSGNSASSGGGLDNQSSDPIVSGCMFSLNTAADTGGGVNNNNSDPAVTGCTFFGNTSDFVGAGMYNISSSPTVANCAFLVNASTNPGGGMFNLSGSNPMLSNCTFSGNSADWSGGGMYNNGSSPTMVNCAFFANSVTFSGGAMVNANSSPSLTNCTFGGNSAASGGAMRNGSSQTVLANCIVWGNGSHQIVDNTGSVTTARYCDIAGGWPGTGNFDADPLFADPAGGDFRLAPESPCIDAGDNTAVPTGITTDLDGNPRLLEIPESPDTGNGVVPIVDIGAYESLGGGCLAVISQEVVCHADGTTFTVNVEGLNACTGGTTQVSFTGGGGAPGEDLCFTALVTDGGLCCSTEICVTIPDCTPVPKSSDLDGDGIVGILDFLSLLEAWGVCPDCSDCPADADGDCAVGIVDILILLASWG